LWPAPLTFIVVVIVVDRLVGGKVSVLGYISILTDYFCSTSQPQCSVEFCFALVLSGRSCVAIASECSCLGPKLHRGGLVASIRPFRLTAQCSFSRTFCWYWHDVEHSFRVFGNPLQVIGLLVTFVCYIRCRFFYLLLSCCLLCRCLFSSPVD
jgi:hypothetical protein